MTRSLIEIHFMPSVLYCAHLVQSPVVIESRENYQKRSFRNRCLISNAQGIQVLTIPLKKGKHQQLSIREVKISYDEDWQKQHLSSFRSAYGSAPFFQYYFDILSGIYHDPGPLLYDFNHRIINKICSLLQIAPPTETKSWEKTYSGIDLRGAFSLKNYNSKSLPRYGQLFEDRHGYFPNLCIFDLLFCLGPESKAYLMSIKAV